MKNFFIIVFIFIAAVAVIVIGICISIKSPRKIHIFTYQQDNFRRGLLPSLQNAWMDLIPAQHDDFVVSELAEAATTDDIPWNELPNTDVVISLLKPGNKLLPEERIITCGPLYQRDEEFAKLNIRRASFMISSIHIPFLTDNLFEQFAIDSKNIYFAALDGEVPHFAANPDQKLNILDLSKLSSMEKFPPRSVLFLAVNGQPKDALNEISTLAAEKNLAIVVDRIGYLRSKVFAEYGASPDSLGEGLGRLAAQRFQSPITDGEIRGVAVFVGRYNPEISAFFKLGTAKGTFTPAIVGFED